MGRPLRPLGLVVFRTQCTKENKKTVFFFTYIRPTIFPTSGTAAKVHGKMIEY